MNEKLSIILKYLICLSVIVSSNVFSSPQINQAAADRYIKECYQKFINKLKSKPLKVTYETESGESNWADAEYDKEFKAITIRTGLPLPKTKKGIPYARFGDLNLDSIPDSALYFDGNKSHNESSSGIYPPISNQSYFMWKISLGILMKESGVCT